MRSSPRDAMGSLGRASLPPISVAKVVAAGGVVMGAYLPLGLLKDGYRHIEVKGKVRSTRASFSSTGGRFSVNASAASYYTSSIARQGSAGSPSILVSEANNGANAYFGQIAAGTAPAGTVSEFSIWLPEALVPDGNNKMFNAVTTYFDGTMAPNFNTGGILNMNNAQPLYYFQVMDDVGSALSSDSFIDIIAHP
jgi:hypothetical protein